MHSHNASIACPTCRSPLSVDVGRRIRCGSCHDVVYAPYPIAQQVIDESEAMPAIVDSPTAAAG